MLSKRSNCAIDYSFVQCKWGNLAILFPLIKFPAKFLQW
jgi:hypothetical protein